MGEFEIWNYDLHRLEDNGVVTDCSLKTLEPEDTLDFNFNSANVVSKVIIKVPLLSYIINS